MAATVNEYVLLSQPDKLVLLAEIPARDSSGPRPATTFQLLVEQVYLYGAGDVEDVDTMEEVTCRVPLHDLDCQGAAVDRAFEELVAMMDNPTLRPEVAPEAKKATARVRERCGDGPVDELGGVEFRLRVVFVDYAFEELSDDEESGSDMEFGEFYQGDSGGAWDDDDEDDDDEDDGGQFSARAYGGALMREGGPSDGTLLLSGLQTRSDGPELADQHELTSWDVHRLVRLALDGGGNMEDDEAYQRALAAGTPMSRASRAAVLSQALLSTRQQHQTKAPSRMIRMRTGF